MIIKFSDHNKAFSLMEIAVTIGILSFALVPVLGLLSVSSKQTFNADTVAIGASIAGDLFSEVQQASFDQIEVWESSPPDTFYDREGLQLPDNQASKASFSARMVIESTDIGSEDNPFMKRVLVWVSAASGDSTALIDDAQQKIESNPDSRLPSNIKTFQSLVTRLEKSS